MSVLFECRKSRQVFKFSMLFFIEKLNYFIYILLVGAIFLTVSVFLCRCIRKKMKQSGYLYILYGFMLFSGSIVALALSLGMICLILPQDIIFMHKWTFFFSGWYRMYGGAAVVVVTVAVVVLWGVGLGRKLVEIQQKFKEMNKWYQLNRLVLELQIQECFQKVAEQVQVKRIPMLFCNPAVRIPFLKGIRYPAVIIPQKSFLPEEQTVAFAHELTHLKHHDLLVRYFFQGIFAVYWFVPLEDIWEQELIELQESLCDIAVCKCYKDCFSASTYYQVILNMAGSVQERYENRNGYLISELSNAAGQMERRIGNMSDYRRRIPGTGWQAAINAGGAVWLLLILLVGLLLCDILFLQNGQIEIAKRNNMVFWGSSEKAEADFMNQETDLKNQEIHLAEEEAGLLDTSDDFTKEELSLSAGENCFEWDNLVQYTLKPGEEICSEQFHAEDGDVLALFVIASSNAYEIGLKNNGEKVIVSHAEENASINLELAESDYKVYIRNLGDGELKIEMYCTR